MLITFFLRLSVWQLFWLTIAQWFQWFHLATAFLNICGSKSPNTCKSGSESTGSRLWQVAPTSAHMGCTTCLDRMVLEGPVSHLLASSPSQVLILFPSFWWSRTLGSSYNWTALAVGKVCVSTQLSIYVCASKYWVCVCMCVKVPASTH